jgi:hypothetical protein
MAQINLTSQVHATSWESRLMPDEVIKAAHEDPALWAAQADRIANIDVNLRNGAIAWQEGAQILLANIGPVSGFPSSSVPTIVQNVGEIVLDTGMDPKLLAIRMAQVGVGVAMAATVAIPIVGAVVNAIGAVAQFFLGMASRTPTEAQVIFPPMEQYSEETDTFVVNEQVLPASATLDWTRLLMPRYAGEWKAYGREGKGITARGVVGGGGVGFMPGTQRITGMIQVFWLRRGHAAEVSPEINTSHNDVGSFYPGAAQLLTALHEQCAKVQTQLYNIDTTQIVSAWEDYVGAAFELAAGIYERKTWAVAGTPLADQTLAQNRVFAQDIVAPLLRGPGGRIDLLTTNWTPAQGVPKNTVLSIIKPWCARVRQRQWNNLSRIVGAAYTDPSQGAFRNRQMLDKLHMMRQVLLQHPARHDAKLVDVIDQNYRAQLFDVTVGDTLSAAPPPDKRGPNPKIDPDVPPDPPPPGVGGGVPFGLPGGGTNWPAILLAAGALGLGYKVAKNRRWI